MRRTSGNRQWGLCRGITTLGIRCGRVGIALRWNIWQGGFFRLPRMQRGAKHTYLAVGPLVIEW
jgi:hypothetical protein